MGMLWHTLAYSGILWHTLAYSGIIWHTLAYSGTLWHTLAYSGILWHTLTQPGILWHTLAYSHMGSEYVSREKKLSMVNFLIFVQKNVSTIRFQEIKIRPFGDFEKMRFLCFYIIGV